MKRNIAILFASLVLLLSGFAVSAGPAYAATRSPASLHTAGLTSSAAHAATHSPAGHVTPFASLVPCLPSFNKVGILHEGGWTCYGNSSGQVTVNRTILELDSDDWSGVVDYIDASGEHPGLFCNGQHIVKTIFLKTLFLSPTKEPGCP